MTLKPLPGHHWFLWHAANGSICWFDQNGGVQRAGPFPDFRRAYAHWAEWWLVQIVLAGAVSAAEHQSDDLPEVTCEVGHDLPWVLRSHGVLERYSDPHAAYFAARTWPDSR